LFQNNFLNDIINIMPGLQRTSAAPQKGLNVFGKGTIEGRTKYPGFEPGSAINPRAKAGERFSSVAQPPLPTIRKKRRGGGEDKELERTYGGTGQKGQNSPDEQHGSNATSGHSRPKDAKPASTQRPPPKGGGKRRASAKFLAASARWRSHLAEYRKAHPNMSLKQQMRGAKKTYKKSQPPSFQVKSKPNRTKRKVKRTKRRTGKKKSSLFNLF
jgi:hypothetical protein